MRKIAKLAAGVLGASLLLTACGNTASTPGTSSGSNPASASGSDSSLSGDLVFWTQWSETETQGQVIQQIADDFMEAHPGTNIEIQWCGRDISKTLKPALEGGEQIDIFDYPSQYADQLGDYCLDLTDYTTKSYESLGGKTLEESVLPMLLSTPKVQTGIDDKLVAIGYQPYMTLFMYNQSIFDELQLSAPTTWEEFDAVCAKIKEAGYSPITFDSAYAHWLPGLYLSREKGQDWVIELVNDTTGEMWKDEAVLKMAEAYADFAAKGYFDANVSGNVYPAGQADVGNGKVAMYYNGTWLPNEIADIAGEDFKWGAFNFPDVVEGADKYSTEGVAGSGMLAVNAKCANPDLAMEFLASFYTPENDAQFVNVAGHIPAVPGGTWPASMEGVKPAFESVSSVLKSGASIEANTDLTPVITENFVKLASGQISAQDFVNNMAAAAKQ